MTVQGITVETEPVRRCREVREALAVGQSVGRALAQPTDEDWDYYLADTVARSLARRNTNR